MARIGSPMQITPVDEYQDLFCVNDVFPQHIVDAAQYAYASLFD